MLYGSQMVIRLSSKILCYNCMRVVSGLYKESCCWKVEVTTTWDAQLEWPQDASAQALILRRLT